MVVKFGYSLLVVAALLCCALTGCAGLDAQSARQSPEERAMQRAQERWNALLSKDIAKAYTFISPAGRLGMPLEEYLRRVNGEYWRNTKVKSAKCEPELCEVSLDFDYQVVGVKLSQVITEQWILDGGEWWFVYRG